MDAACRSVCLVAYAITYIIIIIIIIFFFLIIIIIIIKERFNVAFSK